MDTLVLGNYKFFLYCQSILDGATRTVVKSNDGTIGSIVKFHDPVSDVDDYAKVTHAVLCRYDSDVAEFITALTFGEIPEVEETFYPLVM